VSEGPAADRREVRPVVIAYDGSELSAAAARHAAELFPGRPAIVATVWEPGLAMSMSPPDAFGTGTRPLDPETVMAVDRAQRDHAWEVAQRGSELARSLGLAAEPYAVPDERDVADTLIDIAKKRGGAAVVIGSHGISGLRSRLLGGVARKLIQHCDRPVILIRGEKR
jgi:nucleotide-binding universal stress UspA family protein